MDKHLKQAKEDLKYAKDHIGADPEVLTIYFLESIAGALISIAESL